MVPSGVISDRVLVNNSNYGTPIGDYGSRPVEPPKEWYNHLEQRTQFYTKLTDSILKSGFRNPIFCKSIEQGTFVVYGASRLWVAKKQGLEIPTIIADFDGRWSDLGELETKEQIMDKFIDKPETIDLGEDMNIAGCFHSHLREEQVPEGMA